MQKTKLKPILPSLREKKRYLVFEVISAQKVEDFKLVWNAIKNSCLRFVGELGFAKAGMVPLENKWNPKLQRGIIKISHRHVDTVKASLMFADKIEGKEVIVRSIGISGILNKAEKNYLIN